MRIGRIKKNLFASFASPTVARIVILRIVVAAVAVSIAQMATMSRGLHAQPAADRPPKSAASSPTLTSPALPSPAISSPILTADQLRDRLDSLRRELDREKAALAEVQQQHDGQAAELIQRRKQLADRLLGSEIERERGESRLGSLRTQSADAATNAKILAEHAASLAAALRDAGEQLRLHLREVPGSDAWVDRLPSLVANLGWPRTRGETHDDARSPAELVAILDAAHEQATRVGVSEAEIFTATGKRERVALLAVGHVRFAYVTVEDGRAGISLSSAAEATGYRWTEDLDSQTQQLVRAAVKRIASGDVRAAGDVDAGTVAIPLDPTGRLSVESAATGESTTYEWFAAGGLVMIPLVCVAVAALALIVERAIFFFGRNPNAENLAARVLAACLAGDFDEAQRSCSSRRGVVPRVLAECLVRRPLGQRAMEDAIQTQLLHELPKLQRFMAALATLAGVAPLLGLLGTVTGIIATFSVIRSFGNTNPSLMAGGISEALVTTALGLMIAVPVVIVHCLLRSRSDRIVADAERHSATLLTTLVHRTPLTDVCSSSDDAASRQQTSSRVAKPTQQLRAATPRQAAEELTVDR